MMRTLDYDDLKIYSFSFCFFHKEIAFDLRINDLPNCRKYRRKVKRLNK